MFILTEKSKFAITVNKCPNYKVSPFIRQKLIIALAPIAVCAKASTISYCMMHTNYMLKMSTTILPCWYEDTKLKINAFKSYSMVSPTNGSFSHHSFSIYITSSATRYKNRPLCVSHIVDNNSWIQMYPRCNILLMSVGIVHNQL